MSTTSSPAQPLGDPLVDREVAAEPVVLGRDVRQRALAGELERRHALRLALLDALVHSPVVV